MTIQRMMNTLLENLEIAQKSPYVKKPYSWALYHTWKTVDAFEKERTENDAKKSN